MALTLSTVTAALSTLMAPDLTALYNRTAATASVIQTRAGRGKAINWDVVNGSRTAGAYTDGGAYPSATNDTPLAATMPWALYSAPFSISTLAIDAAMSSAETPEELMDIFGEQVLEATRSLASVVNVDLLTGTGSDVTHTTITGLLGGALAASGTYAGLSRSTYTQWQGNVLANGGTGRALSIPLMDAVDQALFAACGESADMIVMPPSTHTAYKGLFTTYTQFMQGSGGQVTKVGASTNDLTYNGVPIRRDKDMTAANVLFLNSKALEIVFLPFARLGIDGSMSQQGGSLPGSNGFGIEQQINIPFKIEALPRSGSSYNFHVACQCQLRIKRPNACAILTDLTA